MLIKYDKDIRYRNTSIATHDDQSLEAVSINDLAQIGSIVKEVDVIGIYNESQIKMLVRFFCFRD